MKSTGHERLGCSTNRGVLPWGMTQRGPEEDKADAFRRIFVRAMDIEDAGFEDKPGWRARFYIWVMWDVWYERLRPRLRRMTPTQSNLTYLGTVIALLVGLATLFEKCRALR